MPDDNEFTVKDYDRIIDDIIDEYFDQHAFNYALKGLTDEDMLGDNILKEFNLKKRMKVEMLGEVPNTGELNSEME